MRATKSLAQTRIFRTMGSLLALVAVVVLAGVTTAHGAVYHGHVGQPITLRGIDAGERIKVKVVKFLRPLTGGSYEQAPEGRRYVGAVLRLTNVGTARFTDSLHNDSRLILRTGRGLEPDYNGGWCDAPAVNITPGDWRRVCVAFLAPRGVALRAFQFTPNSGFGDDTGEWRL